MSFSHFRLRGRRRWQGLRPASATPMEILVDLRWHAALYAEDDMPVRDRAAFLALRVVQRLAYNLGWHAGRLG